MNLVSFVNLQTLDAKTAWNHHMLYECLEQAPNVVLGLQLVSFRRLGVLVGDRGDLFVAPECCWGYDPIRSAKTGCKGSLTLRSAVLG